MSETGSVLKGDPRIEKLRWSRRLSLTSRILFVNVLPLVLLGGGVIYVDAYRKQLLDERFKLALVEAQITAEALAGATPQRQEALLIQIGKEQRLRLRVYGPDGKLEADSFRLAPPSFTLPQAKEVDQDAFALQLDRWFDRVVGAPSLPDYVEPETDDAADWPELTRAREDSLTQIVLRDAPDGTHVINAAAPVGLEGDTLLLTRNPVDITESVRQARSTVALIMLLALLSRPCCRCSSRRRSCGPCANWCRPRCACGRAATGRSKCRDCRSATKSACSRARSPT